MKYLTAVAAALLAMPLQAGEHLGSGDAAAGEGAFRQCIACHVVQNEAGDVLAGRKAKTGPNLYQTTNAPAGAVDGFRYSKPLLEAGEAGLVWDEANFVAYVQDPNGFLRTFLDDKKARSKMAFKVRSEEDAVNLFAYIASLSPEATN